MQNTVTLMQKSLHCWCQKHCSLDAKNTALVITEITALLVTVYKIPLLIVYVREFLLNLHWLSSSVGKSGTLTKCQVPGSNPGLENTLLKYRATDQQSPIFIHLSITLCFIWFLENCWFYHMHRVDYRVSGTYRPSWRIDIQLDWFMTDSVKTQKGRHDCVFISGFTSLPINKILLSNRSDPRFTFAFAIYLFVLFCFHTAKVYKYNVI